MFERRDLSGNEVVLAVTGSLAGEAVTEFHLRVEELVAASYQTIVLDLSQTQGINSTAIGKILMFRNRLAEAGREMKVKGCSESLLKTFKAIKFDTLISVEK